MLGDSGTSAALTAGSGGSKATSCSVFGEVIGAELEDTTFKEPLGDPPEIEPLIDPAGRSRNAIIQIRFDLLFATINLLLLN